MGRGVEPNLITKIAVHIATGNGERTQGWWETDEQYMTEIKLVLKRKHNL